jgi:hypothetical protein
MPRNRPDPDMSARGRIGAFVTLSRFDPVAMNQKAREVFRTRHLVEKARAEAAERGEEISDAEAERRGAMLLKAHYARMTQASLASRRRKQAKS